MLEQLVLANIENGLNSLLQTDRASIGRLRALAGQTIKLSLSQPAHWHVFLVLHEQGISLARHWEAGADCSLYADAGTLVALALAQDKQSLLHRPQVRIDGNSSLLLEFSALLQAMQLDWEYLLQQWLGPVVSSLLAGHLKQRAGWLRSGSAHLLDNFSDYLAEETRLLVGQREADARLAGVQEMQLQLDRLQARVAILSQQVKTKS